MSDLFDLSDEIIIITGGTGTIGKAFSQALLNAGAKVALWSRGKTVPISDTTDKLAELTGAGDRIFGFPVDVSDKDSVRKGLSRVIETMGKPTVLINGAGGNKGKAPIIDTDLGTFQEVLKLNLLGGLMIPTQILAEYWIDNKIPGSIINVASMTSYKPLSGVWAYGAAKAAVLNLTMGCANEFAPYGIRVNGIAPGFFLGYQNRDLLYKNYENKELSERGNSIIERTPFKRFGKEEDLFGTVVYLASRKASGFITGVTVPVDGGYMVDNI